MDIKQSLFALPLFAAALAANAQFTVRPWTQGNEVLHMSDEGFVRWRRAVEPVFDAVCAK